MLYSSFMDIRKFLIFIKIHTFTFREMFSMSKISKLILSSIAQNLIGRRNRQISKNLIMVKIKIPF